VPLRVRELTRTSSSPASTSRSSQLAQPRPGRLRVPRTSSYKLKARHRHGDRYGASPLCRIVSLPAPLDPLALDRVQRADAHPLLQSADLADKFDTMRDLIAEMGIVVAVGVPDDELLSRGVDLGNIRPVKTASFADLVILAFLLVLNRPHGSLPYIGGVRPSPAQCVARLRRLVDIATNNGDTTTAYSEWRLRRAVKSFVIQPDFIMVSHILSLSLSPPPVPRPSLTSFLPQCPLPHAQHVPTPEEKLAALEEKYEALLDKYAAATDRVIRDAHSRETRARANDSRLSASYRARQAAAAQAAAAPDTRPLSRAQQQQREPGPDASSSRAKLEGRSASDDDSSTSAHSRRALPSGTPYSPPRAPLDDRTPRGSSSTARAAAAEAGKKSPTRAGVQSPIGGKASTPMSSDEGDGTSEAEHGAVAPVGRSAAAGAARRPAEGPSTPSRSRAGGRSGRTPAEVERGGGGAAESGEGGAPGPEPDAALAQRRQPMREAKTPRAARSAMQ